MKKLSLVVALVVFAFPAAASAKRGGDGHKNSAKYCKALRAEMGADAFRAAFGGKGHKKNAFGRCVAADRKAKKAARKRARKSCRSAGLRGPAMKRCVRDKLAAEPVAKPAEYQAAVEQCEAERAEDPEGFADEYGDGPNAFSACVADEVSDDTDEIDEPETGDETDGAEEPDPADDSSDEPDPELL